MGKEVRHAYALKAVMQAIKRGDKDLVLRHYRIYNEIVEFELNIAKDPKTRIRLLKLRGDLIVTRYYEPLISGNTIRATLSRHLATLFQAEPEVEVFSKKNGIWLIELLCTPANREAVIGDIIEQYENVRETQGERRADIWFRTQIMWTALSLLDQRLRSLPRIALATLALSWIGRKLAGC